MAKVLLKKEGISQKEILLDEDVITIGRQQMNHIHIDDTTVSGIHAKIIKEGSLFLIQDMGSLNGIIFNSKNIKDNRLIVLKDGDEIIIGKGTLTFLDDNKKIDKLEGFRKGRSFSGTAMVDIKNQFSQQSARAGFFIINNATLETKYYNLNNKTTTMGKDKNADIPLKGLFIPKIAAQINRNDEGYFISSVGYKNIIKINGKKLKERYKLKKGDLLEVANMKMEFS